MAGEFLKTLEQYGTLSAQDQAAVRQLSGSLRRFRPGEEIVVSGPPAPHCAVLAGGQAFRYKLLADGRRQIMSFHVPGDLLDLQGVFLNMDHSVGALTNCDVALVPRTALEALMAAHPAVGRALWRISLMEGAVYREWMVGMGRRSAYARIAHLFCEMVVRLEAAGLATRRRAPLPLSQQHLSDALGLSVVHTNRVLQALRGEGLITFRSGQLGVLDWDGLKAAGEFEAGYLHLDDPKTAEAAPAYAGR